MNTAIGSSEILIAVGALAAVTSSLFIVFTYRGWMRAVRQLPGSGKTEHASIRAVSVVIAAHNEEARLPALLAALAAQEGVREAETLGAQTHGAWELIIVDDRSTDRTADIALSFSDTLPLRVLRVEETPSGFSPKKFALHTGITAARFDTVLLTDADCVPGSRWIAGMRDAYTGATDVVLGLAPLRVPSHAAASGAARYAAFESRRTMMLSIAAAASGVPYMASGRSWGFTRAMYERAGGLPALSGHLGGDDDLLLQRMTATGARVGTCTRQDAIVFSDTPATWGALWRQKLRHYRVSAAYRGRASMLLGVFVGTELLTPLIAFALVALLDGPARLLPPFFWLWKLWYDTGFLVHAFKWSAGESRRPALAFREGMHIFLSAFTGFASFVKPSRW